MRFSGSGIAAIVGPNGCGKSNLSDAISWVLGEQSAKSLRGSRMEDVIFAGTRDRKPLGLASVTLTLVDPQAHAPRIEKTNGANGSNGHVNGHTSGHANGANGHSTSNGTTSDHAATKSEEITVTRRLFRSGESEYLINGRTARLRDIQDIFMGTGLGPESYAIIEQGRIGQILSSRPQDRRAVIEEAAGISKFKTRRRLAEAKLEGAKQNLSRVFDILEEVGRQVNSLKRQAAKARRYEEMRAELMGHLRKAVTGRFRTLERDAVKTALDLNAATTDFQNLTAALGEKESTHTRLQEQCYGTERQLTEARKQLAELQVETERTRGRLEYQAKQIATIEQRMSAGESEASDLDGRLTKLEAELESSAQVLADVAAQTGEVRRNLAAEDSAREEVQNRLRAGEAQLERTRQTVLQLLGEASSLRNQLAQLDEFIAALERDSTRVRKEEELAAADLERLGKLKAALGEKLAARQLELQSLADGRRGVEEELAQRKTEAHDSRRALDEMRGQVARLRARRDSLAEILSHRSYTTETVKRLFTAIERGQAKDLMPAGVLADFVEVDAAWEKATEEFLHEELEYVIVRDFAEAERGIDLMRGNLDGRATFLVHPETATQTAHEQFGRSPVAGDARVAGRLVDVLRLTNGLTGAGANFLPRLVHCFLCRDRASAQQLAIEYPDHYFLLPDGVCYHGYAVGGGKKTGAGPLGLKRELREAEAQLGAKQKELDHISLNLARLDAEIAKLSQESERLRTLHQSEEKENIALDHELRKLIEEIARSNSRLSVARLEMARIAKEGARAKEERRRSVLLIAEKEEKRAAEEGALERGREALAQLQAAAAELSERHSALRVQLAELEERRRSQNNVQIRLESQAREISSRRAEIYAEMERIGVERARLLADNIELDKRSAALAEDISAAETSEAELAANEANGRQALAALDESLKELRARVGEAQEKRAQVELDLVKLQAELKYLDETSRKELNASCAELSAADESEITEDAVIEAEERSRDLRGRIEALGPVNPDALQEHGEAQARYDFLNAQRQDLLDSIRDTEKVISEIDVESRRRFAEAFEGINANFRALFQTLFGGGTGEMRLTDADNASESGIDIVASPPGKKLQNVLLLSGGEKALTAIALLMGIFKYQPSPFCILDEVDAPLDEPNIERLTRLLREMASQTQFIVITHAKRTMEAAQALYGVTMQEPGVSKLVSVKFQPAAPPPSQQAEAARAHVI
jgi:chromosome segregation protein